MDRIALVSDLHGNLTAWRAVVADLRATGIETVVCLGDLVGKGPDPVGVIDLAEDVCGPVVRGNWETAVLTPDVSEPLVDWQRDQLSLDRRSYLAGLGNAVDLLVSGRRVRTFHASSTAETHRVFPSSDDVELDAMFANTAFTGFEDPEPDVVAYGDQHDTFMINRTVREVPRTLLNVGSVGNPLDGTTAAFVVLHGRRGSSQPDGFGVEVRRCPYDIEAEVRIARESGMTGAEAYVRELRTGIYRAFH